MSQGERLILTGLGHFHPENVVENTFFQELGIDSDANWIVDRTGIGSRRSVLQKLDIVALSRKEKTVAELRVEGRIMTIAEMSKRAWTVLEKRDPTARQNLDMLICGTSVPDFDIPANGCTIAEAIGVEAPSIDVNSACSSFVVDLHIAKSLLRSGTSRKVAVFNPERYSVRLDYSERGSCVLFGDGCSAATIERTSSDSTSGLEIIDTVVLGTPSKFDLVKIPVDCCFYQNGAAVQKFAITRTVEVTEEILKRNNFSVQDLSYFVGHQANLRMLTSCISKLGIPPERHLSNIEQFGNQGAAGAPSVLSMNWDRFKSGDLIAVAVVGSGLTWAAALLRKI